MFLQHDAERCEKEESESPNDEGVEMPGMVRSPETPLGQQVDRQLPGSGAGGDQVDPALCPAPGANARTCRCTPRAQTSPATAISR